MLVLLHGSGASYYGQNHWKFSEQHIVFFRSGAIAIKGRGWGWNRAIAYLLFPGNLRILHVSSVLNEAV